VGCFEPFLLHVGIEPSPKALVTNNRFGVILGDNHMQVELAAQSQPEPARRRYLDGMRAPTRPALLLEKYAAFHEPAECAL
jgi:hypothetical protein